MRINHFIDVFNVIYKLVSKVPSSGLKLVLRECISINQTTFLPYRSILDNVMASINIILYTRFIIKGQVGDIDLKIDTSKLCDRID